MSKPSLWALLGVFVCVSIIAWIKLIADALRGRLPKPGDDPDRTEGDW